MNSKIYSSNSLIFTYSFVFLSCPMCCTLSSTVCTCKSCQQSKPHQCNLFFFRGVMTPSLRTPPLHGEMCVCCCAGCFGWIADGSAPGTSRHSCTASAESECSLFPKFFEQQIQNKLLGKQCFHTDVSQWHSYGGHDESLLLHLVCK